MIVADAGPLNYLVLIGCMEHLPTLYETVWIPHEVALELEHERAPKLVRAWLDNLPSWVKRMQPGPRGVPVHGLHAGETAAIEAALSMGRQLLLIDELRGRQQAMRLNLPVVGTVGFLYQAATLGLIDFDEQLGKLATTNFFLAASVREHYLSLWRQHLLNRTIDS